MISPNQYQIDQQRRNHLLREAELARLADEFHHAAPVYAPLLANVGKTLLHLGTNLKERYGELQPQPAARYHTETA